MGSNRFLTTFISVLAATLFFYGVSAGGALAVNSVFSSKKNFGIQTYIGALDVSNTTEDEAKERLGAEIADLNENFQATLVYQDVLVDLPQEVVTFDLEETIEQAKSSYENELKMVISREGLWAFLNQQFSPLHFSEAEVKEIAIGIEEQLGTGLMPSNVFVTDYVSGTDYAKKEVSTTTINLSHASKPLVNAVQLLNETEIDANETFSMLEFVENNNLGLITNDELTVIASALYTNVLQTNFSVDERYIGEVLNKDISIGYEASMNEQLGIDFKFTNLNKSSFIIKAEIIGTQLQVKLIGLPFFHTYELYVSGVEHFKPRTVQEFSAMVAKGKIEIKQAGVDGEEATLSRTISHRNTELSNAVISKDYYAPIHQVEVYPLKVDEPVNTEPNTNTDANPDTNTNNPNNSGNNDGNQTGDSGNTQTGDQNSTGNGADDEDEIIYDKGGNVVN